VRRRRRVVVTVRAVEYFMLNPRTAFVKNAPSASRGGEANLSVKFEMIERFVSEVTRCVFGLLMWLGFLIMHLIDATRAAAAVTAVQRRVDDDRAKHPKFLTGDRQRQ